MTIGKSTRMYIAEKAPLAHQDQCSWCLRHLIDSGPCTFITTMQRKIRDFGMMEMEHLNSTHFSESTPNYKLSWTRHTAVNQNTFKQNASELKFLLKIHQPKHQFSPKIK